MPWTSPEEQMHKRYLQHNRKDLFKRHDESLHGPTWVQPYTHCMHLIQSEHRTDKQTRTPEK